MTDENVLLTDYRIVFPSGNPPGEASLPMFTTKSSNMWRLQVEPIYSVNYAFHFNTTYPLPGDKYIRAELTNCQELAYQKKLEIVGSKLNDNFMTVLD